MRDLIVHGNDLIVATHGRGFWILDDVTPLRELARAGANPLGGGRRAYLFAPERAYRVRNDVNTDTPLPPEEPAGQNPPDGAILDYALESGARRVVLTIEDAGGRVVRRYASDDPAPPPIPHLDKPAYWERPFRRPPATAGMHRFVWDLRAAAPQSVAVDLPIAAVAHDTPRVPQGPLVVPGTYVVRLEADGFVTQRTLRVAMDPRITLSPGALREQYALATRLCSVMNDSFRERVAAAASGLSKQAAAYDELNSDAGVLLDTIDGADAAPTRQADRAVGELEARRRALQGRPPQSPHGR